MSPKFCVLDVVHACRCFAGETQWVPDNFHLLEMENNKKVSKGLLFKETSNRNERQPEKAQYRNVSFDGNVKNCSDVLESNISA